MWHTGGDKYSVNISGPWLLQFGCEGVLKILNEMMTDSVTYLIKNPA